jgi:hypothetical protein
MKERAAAVVVTFTTGSALVVLAVRGVYVRWFSDDYSVPAAVAFHGFWGGQAEWYRLWSGRFTFTFIDAVLASIGPWTAALVVPVTILAMVCALHARLRHWALVLAIAWAILLGVSDVPQSVLWETGLLSYLAPLAAFAWWIGNAAERKEWRWYDVIIPFAAGGCSETEVLAQIVVCAAAFAAWRRRPMLVALIASSICLAAIAVAPGNAVRRGQYPPAPSIGHVIAATAVDTASFFADAVTRSGLMLLLVFLTAALFAPRLPRRLAIVAAVCTIACAAVTLAACEAALGIALPQRARVIAYALLVVAAAAIGAVIPRPDRWRTALVIAFTVAAAVLPLITAVQLARQIPEARTFAARWDRLDAFLRGSRGRIVFVDNAPATIGTLPFMAHDPVINIMITRTYGLQWIAGTPLHRNGRLVIGPPPNDAVRYRFQ